MSEEAELRTRLEMEHGVARLPKRARDLMFAKAWDDRHSYGLQAVADDYGDLADIALAAVTERE